MIESGEIIFSEDETRIIRKTYLADQKGLAPSSLWIDLDETGHNRNAKYELNRIFNELHTSEQFKTPKPTKLLNKVLSVACGSSAVVLDSFAGSGTTAHAVLEANKRDGGNRRFILVEAEDYANSVTAERVRRAINGYSFTGTWRESLLRTELNWNAFVSRSEEIIEKVQSIERVEGSSYDRVVKEFKNGVLTVTGERKVMEKAPGVGGSFTFCTLGEPIQIESLLTGEGLPSYETLARYVFYTATGQSLESAVNPAEDGFVGETELFRIHLFYQPDPAWLRSNEATLNAERVSAVAKGNAGGKRAIVFAVAKFMSQRELTAQRIEFCQLPYAVHRILGD